MNFKEYISDRFSENRSTIMKNDIDYVSHIRESAMLSFNRLSMPHTGMESWRNTNLEETLSQNYDMVLIPPPRELDINSIFRCEVHNFETFLFTQLNGWYVYENSPVTVLPSGTIVGSLAHAFRKYPELIEKHFGKYADIDHLGLTALNTAFAQDGIFIYVPDGVKVGKPIQMVNVVSYKGNMM
jgi:Fe-S cluster assembly protein SufD